MIYNKSNKNLDWDTKKLNELGDFSRGKSKHRPRNDVKLFSKKGYPLIQTGEVKNANLYINENKDYYNDFGLKQSKLWNKGTLAITIAANIADSAILGYDMCFPDSIVGFEPYKKETSSEYMHYVLSYIQQSIQKSVNGSIQDNINIEYLQALDFKMPKKQIQDEILDIIISLDKKIETNNKINAELEKMAKTLYDYWFVQFDFPNEDGKPYRTSGGAMTYNPTLKREIPTDWKNGTFSNMIDECVGGEWGDENAFNDSIKVNCLRGADIGELLAGNYPNCPTRHIGKNKQSKLIVDTAIVIEISGGSPSQSTGRSALITKEIIKDFDDKVVCSNFCRAIVSKTNYEYYLYGLLQSYYNNGVFFNFEGKTTGIKNLLLESFFASKIVIPSEDILTNFNKKVEILYKEKSKKIIENKQLAELRDFLLPLLMTGQVQVVEKPNNILKNLNQEYLYQKWRNKIIDEDLPAVARGGSIDEDTLREVFYAIHKNIKFN